MDTLSRPLADNKEHDSRGECAKDKIHTSTTAGISGGKKGAYSIVMSGGYEDLDGGDTMCVTDHCFLARFISPCCRTYTGTGGYGDTNRYGGGGSRSWGSGIQIEDQSFEHKDNEALYVSHRSAGERVVDHLTDILRDGQTRPGRPWIQLALQIRSVRGVRGW